MTPDLPFFEAPDHKSSGGGNEIDITEVLYGATVVLKNVVSLHVAIGPGGKYYVVGKGEHASYKERVLTGEMVVGQPVTVVDKDDSLISAIVVETIPAWLKKPEPYIIRADTKVTLPTRGIR